MKIYSNPPPFHFTTNPYITGFGLWLNSRESKPGRLEAASVWMLCICGSPIHLYFTAGNFHVPSYRVGTVCSVLVAGTDGYVEFIYYAPPCLNTAFNPIPNMS